MKRIFVVLLPALLLWGCGGGNSASVSNGPAGRQSTKIDISGALDVSMPPPTINTTLYDALGNAHTLQITLSNPVHNPAHVAGVPNNATQRWDVQMKLDGVTLPVLKLYAIPDGAGGNTYAFTDPTAAYPAPILASFQPIHVVGIGGAATFPVTVNFGGLSAKSSLTAVVDGHGSPAPVQTTLLSLKGNLNLDGSAPVVISGTVYSANGDAFTVKTTLYNPTYSPAAGVNVPAGALQQWDVKIEVDTIPSTAFTTVYDSSVGANNESKVYYVPGSGFLTTDGTNPAQTLGSTIQLTGGSFPASSYNRGLQTATGFPFAIDLSKITTSTVAGAGDGQGAGH